MGSDPRPAACDAGRVNRFVVVVGLLAGFAGGCYDPTVGASVPCSALGECPDGQHCEPATLRCVTMLDPVDAAVDPDGPPLDAPPLDAPPPPFVDDFERPDDPVIGNGWIEKTESTYSLTGGRITRPNTPTSYRDNLVYRPATEDVRDVEISIRARFTTATTGSPQIFIRVVSSTASTPGAYDGYLLYVAGGSGGADIVLGRQRGTPFVVTLATTTLVSPLDTMSEFRLSLRAEGVDPVMLRAQVERLEGTTWTLLGEIVTTDADPTRLDGAGSVGFSGDATGTVIYDDFSRTLL